MRTYGPRVKESALISNNKKIDSENSKISLVGKKKHNGEITPYVLKCAEGVNSKIIVMQAVLADLARRVFSSEFTPKNRVIISCKEISLLSKFIVFTKASRLSGQEKKYLVSKNQRDLAKLIISMVGFANPDLHASNWGVDDKGKIIAFDFDRAFLGWFERYLPKDNRVTNATTERLLTIYPHLIYLANQLFEIMSAEDVEQLRLHDAKPYNHPFCFNASNRYSKTDDMLNIDPIFLALDQDVVYKKWLYYYATKLFLLTNDDHLKMIIKDHSLGNEQDDNMLFLSIKEHIMKMRAAFFQIEKYRVFVETLESDISLCEELKQEIADSNLEFCDRSKNPKSHKAYRCLEIQKIFELLRSLKDEIIDYKKNETPQKLIEIKMRLHMDRILQALSILEKFDVIFSKEDEKINNFQKLNDKYKKQYCVSFNDPASKQAKEEFEQFASDHDLCEIENIDPDSTQNKFSTIYTYLLRLEMHIKNYRFNLSFWRSTQETFLTKQIKSLFVLWPSLKENQQILFDLNEIVHKIFLTTSFKKNIPPEVYQHLRENITTFVTQAPYAHSSMAKFYVSFSNQQTNKPTNQQINKSTKQQKNTVRVGFFAKKTTTQATAQTTTQAHRDPTNLLAKK